MSLLPLTDPPGADAPRPAPVDAGTLLEAAALVDAVRRDGVTALRALAERHDGLAPGDDLVVTGPALARAPDGVDAATRGVLERTAGRIARFAAAQRGCLVDLSVPVAGGGSMGHRVLPLARAGCYAPGGRYAYPSSVLMTAVTARAAGVGEVWVASPRPGPATLAAAAIAGADAVLAAGGAHAVAALAHGAGPVPACDAVVGPGNRWVTAAKQLVAGTVRIDNLAGPSELVVLADASADARLAAADLIAQAEHDPDARVVLVTTSEALVAAVRRELVAQLASLPTAATARASLAHGRAHLVADLAAGAAVCNRLAPEHLQVVVADPDAVVPQLVNFGGLFVGEGAAEVLGDYGAGPNHVLPTGGTARSFAGLSVLTFLRCPTFLVHPGVGLPDDVVRDAVALAELEGLSGHAAAARLRR